MSIPIELLTMGAGAISGAVFKFMGMMAANKRLQTKLLLQRFDAEHKAREEVREGPKHGRTGFQWTRRIIALSVVFSVIVIPKLAAFTNTAPSVVYAWEETTTKFLWFGGNVVQHWTAMNGIVISPVDIHATMAIIGLYFGASIVGSK